MADDMDVDGVQNPKTKKEGKDSGKARFEVKKVRRLIFGRQKFFISCLICSGMLYRFGRGVR